jgi:hypothetical protein
MLPQSIGRHSFAVVLLRFIDIPELSIPKSDFVDFVADGVSGNLDDYWKQISYRHIDITGSQVFGWYTMKYAFSDLYDITKVSQLDNRAAWIAEAKRLATGAGIDLSGFAGVVAVINGAAVDSNLGSDLVMNIMGDWGQNDWMWCNQCGCLTFTKGQTQGKCAGAAVAGGPHAHVGSRNYIVANNMPNCPGQHMWRWCKNCMGLFYSATGASVCPAAPEGGPHDGSISGDYVLPSSPLGTPADKLVFPWQYNWNWCRKCGCLAFNAGPNVCPKDGGRHDFTWSPNYSIVADRSTYDHYNLSFTGHEMGHCFGFMHARGKDSTQEYGDPIDVMAGGPTFNSTRWAPAGPGMSAASLFREGWLASDRVWTMPLGGTGTDHFNLAPVNHPEIPGNLLGRVVFGDRIFTVELRTPSGWDKGLAAPSVVVHEMLSLFTAGQNGWRYCQKCNGLHFMGSAPCPFGGVHDPTDSSEYSVPLEGFINGQAGWKWCRKCQNLTFGDGVCTAGGHHDRTTDPSFALFNNDPTAPGQDGWRYCRNCQALCFGGSAVRGSCPAGGWHDFSQSGNYTVPPVSDPLKFLPGWRWCRQCQALFWQITSTCPGGGYHDVAGSSDYSLVFDNVTFSGQSGWRWCWRCQGLAFAGGGSGGACPAGGAHDYSASGAYKLQFSSSNLPGQGEWKHCTRCQGLVFGGAGSAGPCPAAPAGSQHDFSGSGDYLLANHGVDNTYAPAGTLLKGQQFQDAAHGLTVKVDDIANGGASAAVTIVKT